MARRRWRLATLPGRYSTFISPLFTEKIDFGEEKKKSILFHEKDFFFF
jgi:hypothetical protein